MFLFCLQDFKAALGYHLDKFKYSNATTGMNLWYTNFHAGEARGGNLLSLEATRQMSLSLK